MKTPFVKNLKNHPFIIFWIGLLTGALIIGLIFFYKAAEMKELESTVLRGLNLNQQMVNPASLKVLPTPPGGRVILPTPTGGKVALPTPTGGRTAK